MPTLNENQKQKGNENLENFLGNNPELADIIQRSRFFRDNLSSGHLKGDQSIGDLLRDMLLPQLLNTRTFGRDAFPLAMGTLLKMLSEQGLDPERLASRHREVGRGADAAMQQFEESRRSTGLRTEGSAATTAAIRADASNRRLGLTLQEEQAGHDRQRDLLAEFREMFLSPSMFGLDQDRANRAAEIGANTARGDRKGQFFSTLLGGFGKLLGQVGLNAADPDDGELTGAGADFGFSDVSDDDLFGTSDSF